MLILHTYMMIMQPFEKLFSVKLWSKLNTEENVLNKRHENVQQTGTCNDLLICNKLEQLLVRAVPVKHIIHFMKALRITSEGEGAFLFSYVLVNIRSGWVKF